MKKLPFILTVVPVLAACANTPTVPAPSAFSSLSGKVANWNQGAADIDIAVRDPQTDKGVVVGHGAIAADGTVSGSLPSADQLSSYFSVPSEEPTDSPDCKYNYKWNDTATRWANLYFLSVKIKGSLVGYLSSGYVHDHSVDESQSHLEFDSIYYADRPFKVTGTYQCQESNYNLKGEISISGAKGWNIVHSIQDTVSKNTVSTTTTEVSTVSGPPSSWQFQSELAPSIVH